jgi:hypothetical protein
VRYALFQAISILIVYINYLTHTSTLFPQSLQKQMISLSTQRIKFPGPLESLKELFNPDPCCFMPREQVLDPAFLSVLFKYKRLMIRNKKHLGFGTFILIKE